MILYIDTTDGEYINLALGDKRKVVAKRSLKAKYQQSEKLLKAIDALLKMRVQKTLDNQHKINGIVVVNGPGPFTATRIGVATANALSYALNKAQGTPSHSAGQASSKYPKREIKVVGIKRSEYEDIDELVNKGGALLKKAKKNNIVEPFYNKEPNITVSQKLDSSSLHSVPLARNDKKSFSA